MKLDEYLPVFDFSERHEMTVKSTPEQAYDALLKVDFSESFILRILFQLRGLKTGKFKDLEKSFTLLANDLPQEIVLGLIARPWTPQGQIVAFQKEEFESFNAPNYAKLAWNFTFKNSPEGTIVSTETRIYCTDTSSRRKFSFYWFFVRPFSGLVRIEIFKLLRKKLNS